MSVFDMEKKLTSYEITYDLLMRIEAYLLTDVPTIARIEPADIKQSYSISITDDLGTENFKSVGDFRYFNLFRDFTKKIQISLSHNLLYIWIQFSLDHYLSLIKMRYIGENAREIARSIYERIIEILDTQKTYNYIYHGAFRDNVPLLSWLPLVVGFILILSTFFAPSPAPKSEFYSGIIALLVGVAMVLYSPVGRKIHPYTMFDSRRTRSYREWHNIFKAGIVSFVIFDVFLMLALRVFFGV